MKKLLLGLVAVSLLLSCATSTKDAPVGGQQFYPQEKFITWDRQGLAGGTGVLLGQFAFTRNDGDPDWVIREIGWLTLKPGDSVGLHPHVDNDDAFIILSGTGEFTDSAEKVTQVNEGDIMIAHGGQKHAIKSTGTVPLVFLCAISKPAASVDSSWAPEQQLFPKATLQTWDRVDVGGGKGTLGGKFAYTRNDSKTFPIYELGWLTLPPGTSIGQHAHTDNEDVYVIVSGTGNFIDSAGKKTKTGAGDITIVRPGQSHGLENTGNTDLVFINVIAR
jgi:mannose-6-phosphate isomerase-like protein (cupin superfamily)